MTDTDTELPTTVAELRKMVDEAKAQVANLDKERVEKYAAAGRVAFQVVPCPKCKALPGTQCRRNRGMSHDERTAAHEEANASARAAYQQACAAEDLAEKRLARLNQALAKAERREAQEADDNIMLDACLSCTGSVRSLLVHKRDDLYCVDESKNVIGVVGLTVSKGALRQAMKAGVEVIDRPAQHVFFPPWGPQGVMR